MLSGAAGGANVRNSETDRLTQEGAAEFQVRWLVVRISPRRLTVLCPRSDDALSHDLRRYWLQCQVATFWRLRNLQEYNKTQSWFEDRLTAHAWLVMHPTSEQNGHSAFAYFFPTTSVVHQIVWLVRCVCLCVSTVIFKRNILWSGYSVWQFTWTKFRPNS